MNRMIK